MKFRSLLACIVMVLAGITAHGQDNEGLSLSQLWKQAFDNYPGLDALRSQERQADISQTLARNQYLPDVSLQAQNSLGTQNAVGGVFFSLPGIYNVNGLQPGNTSDQATTISGSIVMDWKFYQFGKQKKLQEASRILSRQATHRTHVEELRIQGDLSRTYLQFFYHLGMEAWAQKNTERLKAILKASASRVSAGLSPAADSLLIKATLDQTSSDLNLWKGRRVETKILLARWANIPAKELALKEVSILRTSTVDDSSAPESNHSTHPLLALKEAQIDYAEKQEELASASAFPSLSLLGGAQLRGNSMNADNSLFENWEHSYNSPVHNYAVGFGLTWNIGNAFDSRLERRRYQEALRQKEAETEEAALGLHSQEEIARVQISQSRRQIDEAEHAYESASKAYALYEARYNSGLISVTELLQIRDVLQITERSRIEAYYQYWIQQVILAQAVTDFTHLQEVFN